MSESGSSNRFAPPLAVVADSPTGTGLMLAGRGGRLGAQLLDGLLVMVIVFATMILFGGSFKETFGRGTAGAWAGFMWFIPAWVITLALQAWFLYTRSQTVGKIALKMRVVRSDGSRVSFPRLFFGRMLCMALLGFIPFVGRLVSLVDALLIFRTSRMCLHDQLFDTRVVTAESSENATLAGAARAAAVGAAAAA